MTDENYFLIHKRFGTDVDCHKLLDKVLELEKRIEILEASK